MGQERGLSSILQFSLEGPSHPQLRDGRIAGIAGLTPNQVRCRWSYDGAFIIFVSAIIATAAAMFERILQKSVAI